LRSAFWVERAGARATSGPRAGAAGDGAEVTAAQINLRRHKAETKLAVARHTALKVIAIEAGRVRDDNGLKTKLVWIPPGDFTMGSPEDEKGRDQDENQVPVTLTEGFWLGQHPVTQSEWRRVMQTTPWRGQDYVREGDDYAATYVSWKDAMSFCEKLTQQEQIAGRLPLGWKYTLPTEAQWEYASRSGTKTPFSFGDDHSELGKYAWFDGNAWYAEQKYARPVGQKRANPWGLYDMHGNVFEWCRDWYTRDLAGGTDPQGPSQGSSRVDRGGSWRINAASCRSAYRNRNAPDERNDDLGFRLALVPASSRDQSHQAAVGR